MVLTWMEQYNGTRWESNGDFHVVGAFEDEEQLGSPYLYYVVADFSWDEGAVIGSGHKTPEEAMAMAQRLQSTADGSLTVSIEQAVAALERMNDRHGDESEWTPTKMAVVSIRREEMELAIEIVRGLGAGECPTGHLDEHNIPYGVETLLSGQRIGYGYDHCPKCGSPLNPVPV